MILYLEVRLQCNIVFGGVLEYRKAETTSLLVINVFVCNVILYQARKRDIVFGGSSRDYLKASFIWKQA